MPLILSEKLRGVRLLTLNDNARRNILSAELCRSLSEAVAEANADPEARCILVTGAGSAFCAGADLADLEDAAAGRTAAVQAVYKAFIDLADSPLLTLAAVNGAAFGAGFNLALACDMRIAGARARFDTRFLEIGLHPGGGHSWMLLRAVGWAEAARLLLGGAVVEAEEALRIGLVQRLVPQDALRDAALQAVDRVNDVPRALVERTKASLRHAAQSSHTQSFAQETEAQMWSLGQPAFAELVARLQAGLGRPGPNKSPA